MVLRARPGRDEDERAVVRRLSQARKAPSDAVMRARMIELSWLGLRVPAITVELSCSQKTVRCWLHRFNRSCLQGLSLVKTMPPGRLRWEPVGELWACDEPGPPE
ncbi:helix-turn-helix domain-containing protein [Streptomyces sp. Inha503]|uniref:helix-turn-helix domain-containing protein n=1 Tax=Streptomyces sp. Inha503 TaxID=3383314 RepID=UPI0039A195D8